MTMSRKEHFILAGFLAPAIIVYTTFLLGPVLGSFFYSLTNWNGLYQTMDFVGLRNFVNLMEDGVFAKAIRNTMIFTVFVVLIQNAIGVPLALAMDSRIRSKQVLKTLFFVPAILSPLVVGYTWTYIYEPQNGVLNTILRSVGLTGWEQSWLGDPQFALYSIVVMAVWQFSGYSMVIYLANLQTIPGDLYEAADIDGAGKWQQFKSITFPLLAPSITINIVLSSIGTLKAFDIIYVTTKGGPYYATETMTTLLFSTAFTKSSFGYGTAMGVVMFFFVFIISLAQILLLRRREVH
ncbi:carbohydrate ABC transporter permease [Paenibacillus sp. MY03]|jgi:raffinose/stachyose/melibiose transport system permease protein|uniref:carbohydrate ABC transporter permease n=1 Tax=Paenibacillus sp. MY03 TaxID=302980 RepID=UPI00211ABE71|nr:sugar ABC transporter permease [Paenibacillus sp. MY03]